MRRRVETQPFILREELRWFYFARMSTIMSRWFWRASFILSMWLAMSRYPEISQICFQIKTVILAGCPCADCADCWQCEDICHDGNENAQKCADIADQQFLKCNQACLDDIDCLLQCAKDHDDFISQCPCGQSCPCKNANFMIVKKTIAEHINNSC